MGLKALIRLRKTSFASERLPARFRDPPGFFGRGLQTRLHPVH